VAKKRSEGRHPLAFKKMAVERLKSCDNVVALAEELGVHRRMLYRWRDQFEARDVGEAPPENIKERDLRIQLATAKRLLADKALEVDFFKGALQKVEARRQSSTQPGETASTTKSGS
jgi:transposase-like protein